MDDRTSWVEFGVCKKSVREFFYYEQKLLSKRTQYKGVQYHIYDASKCFVSHEQLKIYIEISVYLNLLIYQGFYLNLLISESKALSL